MKLLVVLFCFRVAAENIGDLRLAGIGATSSAGRLEIFLGGDYGWGTVSHRTFDQRITDVACRQLGYEGGKYIGLAINSSFGVGNSQWTFLNDSRCAGDELHVLRCRWTEGPCVHCDHNEDVAIECSSVPIWANPYEGQVRLVGPYPSKGTVEIYLNHEWGGVCSDNVASAQANSVCRQLGYTNFNGLDFREYSGVLWLKSFHCGEPQACFTSCYSYAEVSKQWTKDCNTGSLVVSCEFILGGSYSTSIDSCQPEPGVNITTASYLPSPSSQTYGTRSTAEPLFTTLPVESATSLQGSATLISMHTTLLGLMPTSAELSFSQQAGVESDEQPSATVPTFSKPMQSTPVPTSVLKSTQEQPSTEITHPAASLIISETAATSTGTHSYQTSNTQPYSIPMVPIILQTTIATETSLSTGLETLVESSSFAVIQSTSTAESIQPTSPLATPAESNTIYQTAHTFTANPLQTTSLIKASTSLATATSAAVSQDSVTFSTETTIRPSSIQSTFVQTQTSVSIPVSLLSSLLTSSLTVSLPAESLRPLSLFSTATESEDFQLSTYPNTAGYSDSISITTTTTTTAAPIPPPSTIDFSTNDIVAMALGSFGLLILAAMLVSIVAYACIQCKSCCRERHKKKEVTYHPGFY